MANKRLNSVLRQKFKTKENDTVCVPFKKPVINCYLFEFYKLRYGLGFKSCFKTSSINANNPELVLLFVSCAYV